MSEHNSGEEHQETIPEQEELPQEDQEPEHSIISKGQYSYKEVSEMSDVTEESVPEGVIYGQTRDLENLDRLKEQTKTKLRILESEAADTENDSRISREEKSDEFLRNFFIKFGMKKTLDSF